MLNKKDYVLKMMLGHPNLATNDKCDIFLVIFEQLIDDIIAKKPLLLRITGDFNVRSSNWWKNDLSTPEGTQVDLFTTSYGLSQIISDPAHVLPYSSSLTSKLKVEFILTP